MRRLFNNRLTRRIGIPGTIAAGVVALTAGVALAAMLIYGTGTFSASAAETQQLTVDNTALTGTLYPGATVGAKGVVHNPNNFPVTVVAVVVSNSGMTVAPAACENHVTLVGGSGVTGYGPTNITGKKFTLATPVAVGAGSAAWVEVPGIVAQDAAGTTTCGVTAQIVVEATAGS